MNERTTTVSEPPSPPDLQRRLAFYPYQIVGVALVLLIPILAIAGVFGETFAETNLSSQDFEILVHYTTRNRYRMMSDLDITVHNLTDQIIPALTVSISNNYIERFSTVTFTPSTLHVTHTHHEVQAGEIAPGESRNVHVEIQGEDYGEHAGTVTVNADGVDPVQVHISTFIFP